MFRAAKVALMLGALLTPGLLQAQDAQEEVAPHERRAAFLAEEGRQLIDDGYTAAARDRLRQSLSLVPSFRTRFNLAIALQGTGELVESSLHLRALMADPTLPARQRVRATELLAEMADAIAWVQVRTDEPARIEVDGYFMGESSAEGLRIEVDPGEHRFAAFARDLRGSADAELAPGERRSLHLSLEPTWRNPWRIWGPILAGSVVVAVAVSLFFVLRSNDEDPRYNTASVVQTLRWSALR